MWTALTVEWVETAQEKGQAAGRLDTAWEHRRRIRPESAQEESAVQQTDKLRCVERFVRR